MDSQRYVVARKRILTTRRAVYIPTTATFSYTGSNQTLTIPGGVTSIDVTLRGSGGGNSTNPIGGVEAAGGPGGLVSGTLAVTPGETLTLVVGGYLDTGLNKGDGASTGRSYGGGGCAGTGNLSSRLGGIGGGRTAIVRGGVDIVTAGGGGGGGYGASNPTPGGSGGGLTGGNGVTSSGYLEAHGLGGTQSAGGILSDGGTSTQGAKALGGNAPGNKNFAGGGGSGWYGGGGALGGASGGGGSSYVGNLTGTVVNTQGGGAAMNTAGSMTIVY